MLPGTRYDWFGTQDMMAILKSVRMNSNYLAICRFANKEAILPRYKPSLDSHNRWDDCSGVQTCALPISPPLSFCVLKLDMFVGGLPVAGENVADAARNEVRDTLNQIGRASCRERV